MKFSGTVKVEIDGKEIEVDLLKTHMDAGGSPEQILLWALTSKLRERLETAWVKFSDNNDYGREGAADACRIINEFLNLEVGSGHGGSIFALIGVSLGDVDKGKLPELFSKTDGRPRRSRSEQYKFLRRTAAACLEVLVEENENVEIAAAKVARHVGSWTTIGTDDVTGATIKGWRQEMRSQPDFKRLCENVSSGGPDRRTAVETFLRRGIPAIPKS